MNEKIAAAVRALYEKDVEIALTRPDPQFGDYATNVALQLSKQIGKNPREIAEEIAAKLSEDDEFKDISVAGPGFLNIRSTDSALLKMAEAKPGTPMAGKDIVAEYSDPNPFKVLHAGHLYTTIVGDAIARLLESAGATVHRVNFGGDVGMHVAKNMWAIVRALNGENPEALKLIDSDPHAQAAWLSARYVEGNEAYESSEDFKAEIIATNKRIYALHADNDHDSAFAQIYWTCREWSYEYFKILYKELEVVPFEKYYPESMTTPIGIETVERELANGVYEKSDGAIVFKGEPYGLHTRVFINSEGLPTYEAKDVGLIMQKWHDYNFDRSIIITGNDITEYMKVVQKSIEQYEPELVSRSTHITHGNLKLAGGKKMSSRKGTVLLAMDVLNAARVAQAAQHDMPNEATMLGAVKYAFLMNRIGGDIIYDPEKSVSLQGNSGPYLQYAHARARRIIEKATTSSTAPLYDTKLNDSERDLVRTIGEYAEVVERACLELSPHLICTYLFDLAQSFNRFYEQNRVIGHEQEVGRLRLVGLYADTLKNGLGLLGIAAPESM